MDAIRKRLEQELRSATARLRQMGGTDALDELRPVGDTAFADEPGFVLMVGFHFVAGSDAPIFVTDANIGGAPKYAWAVRGGSAGMSSY